MTIHQEQNNSSLLLHLMFSLGLHIIGISLFVVLSPKFIKEKYTSVSITIGSSLSKASVSGNISKSVQSPSQPKVQQKPLQSSKSIKTQNIPIEKKAVPIEQKSVSKPEPISQPAKQNTSVPVVRQTPRNQESEIKPVAVPSVPTIQQQTESISDDTKYSDMKKSTPVEQVKKDLSDELDNLLNKKKEQSHSSDFLEGATWSGGIPRRTISFPNITASIPAQYRERGYGFSVTARITFSPQGWVSAVELVQTSGDPRIDSIFRTELRKIRIEPGSTSSYETVIKSFTISVK